MTELATTPECDDILLDAPPLGLDDFEGCVSVNDEEMELIEEFEKLWAEYLEANPHVIPTGQKGEKIQMLQENLKVLQASKQKVEAELERQLDFFHSASLQMEEDFQRALKEQGNVLEVVENTLDAAGSAWRNVQANAAWDLFFDSLEDCIEQSEVQELPGDGLATVMGFNAGSTSSIASPCTTTTSSILKPSPHAMFLNNAAEDGDTRLKSRDFFLRAYRIDNALLRAHLKVLQRDVERVDASLETNEFVGQFLMDQDIFGLLSSANQSTTGLTTRVGSTRTVPSRNLNVTPTDE